MDAGRVTLGRVAGVHGVKGWIRLYSLTRPAQNILNYRRWWIGGADGFEAQVLATQEHNLLAQISGADGRPIEDRDVAAALIGKDIAVDRAAMPKLKKGQYYWADLLGLKVENGEGVALGTVTDVTSNGAQDVLVVGDGDIERLIPFVLGPVVSKVDMAGGRIICDWQPDW